MWFQAIYHARIIALHEVDDSLRVLVPKENMSTVAAADNVLRVGAKEIDALNGATISVNGKEVELIGWISLVGFNVHVSLIKVQILALLVVATVVEINPCIAIRGKNLAATVIVDRASNLCDLCLWRKEIVRRVSNDITSSFIVYILQLLGCHHMHRLGQAALIVDPQLVI